MPHPLPPPFLDYPNILAGQLALGFGFGVTATLASLATMPGAWGFAGAFCYAAGQLSSVLFVDTEMASKPSPNAVAKAWVQFFVSLLFGALAAEGFGPTLADMTRGTARPEATWLVIGLSANAAWPVIERTVIGNIIKRLGGGSDPK